jgi:hypothetical protein
MNDKSHSIGYKIHKVDPAPTTLTATIAYIPANGIALCPPDAAHTAGKGHATPSDNARTPDPSTRTVVTTVAVTITIPTTVLKRYYRQRYPEQPYNSGHQSSRVTRSSRYQYWQGNDALTLPL